MKKTTRNYILKEFNSNGEETQKSDTFPASSLARAKQLSSKLQKVKGSRLELYNLGRLIAFRDGIKWEVL